MLVMRLSLNRKNKSVFVCKSILLIAILLLFKDAMKAGDLKYPVSGIPKDLLENAHSVIRQWDIEFRVIDKGHGVYSEHKAITILNKSAEKNADFVQEYNKLIKITDYNLSIYDASGNGIKFLKKSDFKDQSAINDYSLFSDERIIAYSPIVNTYPYTVEYNVEFEDYNLMVYPSWFPQNSFNESVQNSSYKLTIPKGFMFNKLSSNMTDSVKIKDYNNEIEYFWKTENLSAIDYESNSNDVREFSPTLRLAPNEFTVEGYEGSNDSWKSFGEFVFNLNKSKNMLSDKTLTEIKSIVQKTSDKKEKVKLLYEYMQGKTRYINIKIGIGGIKPFDASVVDKLGYGDCKALSNYMKTLLDNCGINSFYTLINAGRKERDITTSFPSSQFSHALLCVPIERDTIWLECTSENTPFNYQSTFTASRHALLITPDGGVLIKTPELKTESNIQIRKAIVNLNESGNGSIAIATKYYGEKFDKMEGLYYLSADDQKKYLNEETELLNFNLDKWNYRIDKSEYPVLNENLDISIRGYGTSTGKRIFIPLNLVNKIKKVQETSKERKTSFVIHWGSIDIDSIEYNLPANLKVEFIPEAKEIKSEFGSYKVEIIENGNKITYIRTFRENSGKYPPEKFKDYLDFRNQVFNYDWIKVILLKN